MRTYIYHIFLFNPPYNPTGQLLFYYSQFYACENEYTESGSLSELQSTDAEPE